MDLFFGKKKKVDEKPITTSSAIQKLKDTIALLEKREIHISKQIDELKNIAKECIKNKQKDKAMYHIKKYKMLEKERESLFGSKLNLETQCLVLSGAVIDTEIFNAMKLGRDAMQKSENRVEPEKVDELMDDIEENMASVREVAESLARPLGPSLDEDTLIEELKAEILEEEVKHVPALHVPDLHVPALNVVSSFPEVPTHVPATHVPATHVPATHVPSSHVTTNTLDKEIEQLKIVLN